MCGICGLAGVPDAAALDRMSATLVHRGPDDDGSMSDGLVALAARRLSIIDLEHGHQPIANEDGRVHVVQNGEIYNHAELRKRLSGHRFATRCDTEVLVHGWEEWGEGMFERLRGMFAVAIWDAREQRLLLARDRFGIKPLYWSARDGGLAFASELKALVQAPGFRREVDLDAVEAYLAFNSIPSPLTIWRDARKLPAGHLLEWRPGSEPVLRCYAAELPARAGELRTESEDVLAAELLERLRDSVRAHLVSDVPVGVLLSGGVDSSALAALAAQEGGEQVSTFSIGFEEASFDELSRARLIARRYGTDHHELVVRPDAVELLPRIVDAFDEPFADSSALPTYLVASLASQHVKVALSGEGADELFGGYYTYVADLLAPRVGRLAGVARPLVERLPSSSEKVSFDYKLRRFARGAGLPPLERHHSWKEIFSPAARDELCRRDRRGEFDPLDLYRARFVETEGSEPLARLQDVDLRVYLVDDLLVKTDRASMAHSLEARVPFLDTAVSDLALALPTRHKVRGFSKKRLLRKALEPVVPAEILHGRKHGFSIPAAAWLRGELQPFAREVLSPASIERQGFFDPQAVTALLDRHVARREDLSRQLWGLMSFCLWHERHAAAVPERPKPLIR